MPVTSAEIVPANPNRFALFFSPQSIGNFFVTPFSPATVGAGFPVVANVQQNWMTFRDYPALINLRWYGIANAAPITTYFIEIVYNPRGDD